MNETDNQLLEAYLDDGLSTSEVHRLDSRLCDEPMLMAALDAIRNERAARIAAFQLMASQAEADRLADSVVANVRRRRRMMIAGRYMRVAVGIAASLAIGFAVGWIGRGGAVVRPSQIPAMTVATPAAVHTIHTPKTPEPGQYQVAIIDENGNVIAIQHFGKLEDARRFADDLGQYEIRNRQVQESQAMLVSDRF